MNISKEIIQGTITPLVTPFSKDGSVDFKSLEKLFEFQVSNGVKSFVPCGSTGEAAMLSDEEYRSVITRVKELCGNEYGCIPGIGQSATNKACDAANFAAKIKADAVLLVTPPYVKPTQAGILEHFRQVKSASKLPIVAYNIPGRSGANMLPTTIAQLVNEGLIIGLKDSTGSIEQLLDTVKLIGNSIAILSGEDSLIHAIMACGGVGTISATANIIPDKIVELTNKFLDGESKVAFKVQLEVLPIIRLMFIETNPIVVKAALAEQGIISSPTVRLPLTPAQETTVQKVRELFKK